MNKLTFCTTILERLDQLDSEYPDKEKFKDKEGNLNKDLYEHCRSSWTGERFALLQLLTKMLDRGYPANRVAK